MVIQISVNSIEILLEDRERLYYVITNRNQEFITWKNRVTTIQRFKLDLFIKLKIFSFFA